MTRTHRHTTARTATAAVALSLALLAAGCSGDGAPGTEGAAATPTPSSPTSTPTAPSSGPTQEPTQQTGPTLEVGVTGDTITPNGATLDVAVGEPVTIEFDADRPGELHVHSRPEQVLSFDAGTSTTKLVIDNPGAVDIEEHETGIVIAQLEVR